MDTLLLTQLPRLPVRNLLQHVPLGLLHSLSVWLEVLVQHELDQFILLPHSERLLDDVSDSVLFDPLYESLFLLQCVIPLLRTRCPGLKESLALTRGHAFKLTEVGLSVLSVALLSACLGLPLALLAELLSLLLFYIMRVKVVRNVCSVAG